MAVRDAQFADIPRIYSLLNAAHLRSHYALAGNAEIDEKEAKRLLVQCIQRHGNKNGGATWVQVAESNGAINGLIVGTLTRVYSIYNRLSCSDLFWVASEDVDPVDPIRLMRGMIEWAKSCPHVVEIKCGTTAVISDDPKRAGTILERIGMVHYGEIYRMEIEA